jgi:protein SCO1/2
MESTMTRSHTHNSNTRRADRSMAVAWMCVVMVAVGVVGGAPSALAQGYIAEGPAIRNAVDMMPKGVSITENPGDELDLSLTFTDDTGKTVTLGDYFNQGKPVVFTMVYYNCPMLCTFALNGARDVIRDMEWAPGDDYTLLAVSFDPREGPELSGPKKATYIQDLGVEGAENGWHFLTGEAEPIEKLTDALGFGYEWVEAQGEFAHASALIVVTPDGRISRYLNGVYYDPNTLRLTLVEAAGGKIGKVIDNLSLMFCYRYDPESGTYAADAFKLMRLGGLVTVAFILITVFAFWRHEIKHRKLDNPTNPSHGQPHHA